MENLIEILNRKIEGHNISYANEGKRSRIYVDKIKTEITLPNTDVEKSDYDRAFAERELIKILTTKLNNFIKNM